MANNVVDVEQLFELYKTDVYRFALAITRDKYLSEDITQDVFLSLIRNANKVSDIKRIKSWLLTTTKNSSISALRKRSFEVGEIDTSSFDIGKDIYQSEFFSMLDCLDEKDRQIVALHIVNRMRHREIAQIIGIKPGTVRQRYVRSLKIIKQNLLEELK
ncbi:MAG: sigma-70 family RNA polymerase sigma factor [Clostridia bacterium]|nr:sigma-70 family RNA polymerase sigma factor [Clostridia bacterium]